MPSSEHGPRCAIGIAGAGRVAQALGRILRENGDPVAYIASRTPGHAEAGAGFIGGGVVAVSYPELARESARILVCVSDAAIDSVARQLGGFHGVALHTSGARGPEALDALKAQGASCGAIHPLQTIATAAGGVAALHGIAFAVDGDEAAAQWAEEIVKAAEGRVIRIAPEARPLYHAAAVMAGNYVIAVMGAAGALLAGAGVDPGVAQGALAPLARQSLENTLRDGPDGALTGPIERGDAATVAAHLRAIEPFPEAIRSLYRAAGIATLEIAQRRGLPPDRAAAIRKLLQGESSRL